jgi:hypothetical protein
VTGAYYIFYDFKRWVAIHLIVSLMSSRKAFLIERH